MKSTSVFIAIRALRSLGAALIITAMGCGGDLPGAYYYPRGHDYPPGPGADGGACTYYGGSYACGCVDQPYVLGVSMALENNGALTDLDVELFRQNQASANVSAQPPAKGTAGANTYDIATLLSTDGIVQSSFVFANPLAVATAGTSARHGHVEFAMPVAPGVSTLHVENWDSGAPLIDLDLRGHVQLLCVDRPCLSICQSPDGGMDSSVVPTLDGGALDSGAIDGLLIDGF
jgi:hypothetical protein